MDGEFLEKIEDEDFLLSLEREQISLQTLDGRRSERCREAGVFLGAHTILFPCIDPALRNAPHREGGPFRLPCFLPLTCLRLA